MSGGEGLIHAYEIHLEPDIPILPAPIERHWMDVTDQHFAYRCLPLVIANQAGWLIQNPCKFTARWNGGIAKEDLVIEFEQQPPDSRILSHFGSGVLTISLPYLFRTPQGINLWVKGPSNWIKDGAQPLEGVVESDWSPATFTMNWKVTRPGHPVRFERGEPICMIVPVPRGLAENLQPCREPLHNNPELEEQYRIWDRRRNEFLQSLSQQAAEAVHRGWQKDYFQGHSPEGPRFREHQTRLHLRDFVGPDGKAYAPLEFPHARAEQGAVLPTGEAELVARGTASEGIPTASVTGTQATPLSVDRSKCVILVPVAHHIEPDCDSALRELEARGYPVWRVWGYSAIDQGRSQMASEALGQGFEELVWIDADIGFEPEAVERLRSHNLPVVCAIYPQKARRSLACIVLPEAEQIIFGEGGGLVELQYGVTGFLLTRREVYEEIQRNERLPVCNQRFGRLTVPYFLPMIVPDRVGHWYLGEDFSFFERLRRCGYKILADTTIRLRHIGSYGYSWEEAGSAAQRYATYVFNVER